MNVKFAPYVQYRDTNLPWLPDLPTHWEIRRNGRLFAQRNETGFPELPILEVSLRTGVRVRDMVGGSRKQVMSNRAAYKRAVKGDIAYNMMRMWQGAVGTAPVDGLISPAYVVARPFPETTSRFFSYVYRTAVYMDEVDKYSRGIVKDRNRLYWESFKQMPSPFPPPDEQAQIVSFLDSHGSKVNRFIRAKRRMIELLNEQKQAIIQGAVTRGLDPDVRLKPSGVEWLGDVSEHWNVVPLKRFARLHRGYDLPEYNRIAGPFPVVSSGGIIGTHADWMVKGPGVVTGRYGSTGRVFFIQSDFWPHNTSLFVSDFSGNAPRYVFYLLQTLTFEAHSGKSAVPGVDRNDLHTIAVAAPPVPEQHTIYSFLDRELGRLNKVIDEVNNEIDLIREYRTRLIADVVTGKLDVRGANLPSIDTLDVTEEWVDDETDDDTVIEEDHAHEADSEGE